jgi:hypothetical protein
MANDYRIGEALQRVEGGILPGISMMLDTLIDAAALARPGVDAETYAAEIRTLTLQVEELARQVEAAAAVPLPGSSRAAA